MTNPLLLLLERSGTLSWCSGVCLCVGMTACTTSVTVITPESSQSRLSIEQSRDVTVYALGLVGTPYKWGGNTPESGFDCSGLIAHVYQKTAQLKSPRTVAELKNWGSPISTQEIRTGDLVVFSKAGQTTHAGIYVGEGRFVHAPSTGGRVRLDHYSSTYWSNFQIAFARP